MLSNRLRSALNYSAAIAIYSDYSESVLAQHIRTGKIGVILINIERTSLIDRNRKIKAFYVVRDLLPDLPSFIRRVCSSFAPAWGVLRTQSV